MKRAIVVGSGAGGATAAKELQGSFAATVLEAGKDFRAFPIDLSRVEKVKKSGLLFDERLIHLLFPAMSIRRTADRMVLVNGVGLGRTTTLSCGNALRVDRDLQEIGINWTRGSPSCTGIYGRPPSTRNAGVPPPGSCSRYAGTWGWRRPWLSVPRSWPGWE